MNILDTPAGVLRINGHPLPIGADYGTSISRNAVVIGGKFRRTVNAVAVPQARAVARKFAFRLSFANAKIPPDIEEALWQDQLIEVDIPYEQSLTGYVDLAVTPRLGPPLVPLAQKIMWSAVPNTIWFIGPEGQIESDGTNALPSGYAAEDIARTIFCPRMHCIVSEGFDGSLDIDPLNYSGNVSFEER